METFGSRLAEAYKAKGYDRASFTRALGKQYHQVHGWETKGKIPDRANLEAIATLVDRSIDWLLYGDRPATTESRVVPDGDEGHPVVEEFIEDNREDLSDDEVARLRRNFYRGADEDFVKEHLPKYLLSMRRAPKVEDRGEVAKPVVREGARRIGSKPRSAT